MQWLRQWRPPRAGHWAVESGAERRLFAPASWAIVVRVFGAPEVAASVSHGPAVFEQSDSLRCHGLTRRRRSLARHAVGRIGASSPLRRVPPHCTGLGSGALSARRGRSWLGLCHRPFTLQSLQLSRNEH